MYQNYLTCKINEYGPTYEETDKKIIFFYETLKKCKKIKIKNHLTLKF